MPLSISIFLDSRAQSTISRALLADWSDAARQPGDIELLSATQLDDALTRANAPFLAWLNITLPAHEALARVRRTVEIMQHTGAAAASLSAMTPQLSPTGLPTAVASPNVGTRVLIPTAGAAVLDCLKVAAVSRELPVPATYGDADLGWRLALRGLTVVQGEPMEVQSRRPGLSRIDVGRQSRRASLDQLRALFTCAGDEWLSAALPAALARMIAVAGAHAGLEASAFDFGATVPPESALPVETVALLLAIEDFGRTLPMLRARRQHVQRTRTTRDDEILPLFPGDVVDEVWRRASGEGAKALCRMLGLTDLAVRVNTSSPPHPRPSGGTARSTPAFVHGRDTPGVSMIILTRLGPTHLPACLDSLAALDFPADRVEVIVVDNASAIDPAPAIQRHYPAARLLRQERNLGFCGGNNAGFAAARHDWVMFLNDDTRVDSQLLRRLFATIEKRRAKCAGALVLDWDGRQVDFGGGGMNFEARGFQHGMGENVTRWAVERPVLFANGAALLIHREAYQAAGGFPDAYFAYYEDLALGWALWLIGEEVWFSPGARVLHRHHGTSSASSTAARVRNCERNALYTVLTHAEDEALGDLVSASLILAVTRVVLGLGLGGFRADPLAIDDERRMRVRDRISLGVLAGHTKAELLRRGAARRHGLVTSARLVGLHGLAGTLRSLSHLVRWGGPPKTDCVEAREEYPVQAANAATLAAAAEWCANVSRMEAARDGLQAQRQRSTREIVARFGDNWLHAVPVEPLRQAEYEATHRAVADAFSLAAFLSS